MLRTLIILIFVFTVTAYTQESPDSAQIQTASGDTLFDETTDDTEEKLLESYVESADATQLSEELDHYRQNPVDINYASQSELERLPGMPPLAVRQILDYRKNHVFFSIRDLLKVPGFTRETFVRIKEFITVNPDVRAKRYDVAYRQRSKRSIEESRDFRENKFAGNIYQFYQRLNASYYPLMNKPDAELRVGVVMEKDPGENKLNDHQVGFIELRNFPFIRKAVIGNYQLEFGQALSLWSTSGMSKSSETIGSVRKKGRGISAFNYATENAGFFGAALELDLRSMELLKNWNITAFYSYRQLDASYSQDGAVNSILVDGLHRTDSEIAGRNYLLETVEGANVDYRFGASTAGITFYAQQFDRRFIPRDSIRSLYGFNGHENTMVSLHHDVFVGDVNFFGEVARDQANSFAFNFGVQGSWPGTEWVVFYRNYAKDFQSLHGFTFGDQSGKTQNEEGIYTGLKLKPRRGTAIQAYYDIFRYPWRTYSVPKPVTGDDFLIRLEQQVWPRLDVQLQLKSERKDRSVGTTDMLGRDITVIEKEITRRMRYQWDVAISREVRLRSRIEQSWYRVENIQGSSEKGILFYEDVRAELRKNLTLYGRLSFFDTHSFYTALYEYENDVEGVFSNTSFSGKGKRWYVLVKYAWRKNVNLSAKYWELYRDDLEQIGSGGDAITGNVLRKVTMSIDVSL